MGCCLGGIRLWEHEDAQERRDGREAIRPQHQRRTVRLSGRPIRRPRRAIGLTTCQDWLKAKWFPPRAHGIADNRCHARSGVASTTTLITRVLSMVKSGEPAISISHDCLDRGILVLNTAHRHPSEKWQCLTTRFSGRTTSTEARHTCSTAAADSTDQHQGECASRYNWSSQSISGCQRSQ